MILPLLQWKRTLGCCAWLWGTTEVSDKNPNRALTAHWGKAQTGKSTLCPCREDATSRDGCPWNSVCVGSQPGITEHSHRVCWKSSTDLKGMRKQRQGILENVIHMDKEKHFNALVSHWKCLGVTVLCCLPQFLVLPPFFPFRSTQQANEK